MVHESEQRPQSVFRDRSDRVEPQCRKLRTLRFLPRRVVEYADSELPRRMKLRKEIEEPKVTKSKSDRWLPRMHIEYLVPQPR